MKLNSPTQVRKLLEKMEFTPSKSMGQNFLVDGNIREQIIQAAAFVPTDHVIEIGPGLGTLTERILEAGVTRLTAIEKDLRLADYLRARLGKWDTLDVIAGDALKTDFEALAGDQPCKVISNLPYSVGARILVHLAGLPHPPEQILVTVQREVADRMTATPGTKAYGVLTLLLRTEYRISTLKHVGPGCFVPRPRVTSALVQLLRKPPDTPRPLNPTHYRQLVRQVFSGRRKQMGTLLARLPEALAGQIPPAKALDRLELDARLRPEAITPDDWRRLSDILSST